MSDQPTPWPPQSSSVPPPPGGPYGASTPPPPYGAPPSYGAPPYGGQPPYGGPPGYGGGFGGYTGPLPPAKNGLAVAALIVGIFGILGFFTLIIPLLAVGLGLGAASRAKRSNGAIGGAGKARAGWILGLIGTAGFIVFVALIATGVIESDKKSVDDLDVGACYDLPFENGGTEEISTLKEIPCDEPHDGQLFYEGELNPDRDRDYPSDSVLTEESIRACAGRPYEDFMGEPVDITRYDIRVIVPSEVSWKSTRGKFSCFVIDVDESPLIGSLDVSDGAASDATDS